MKRLFFALVFLLCFFHPSSAQTPPAGKVVFIYKKIDSVTLKIEALYPQVPVKKKNNSIVFFFGGGWISGTPDQFRRQAVYLQEKGLVCFLVQYRTRSANGTTPFESLKDAKSALRYIRKNADRLNINKDSIVACGGSAGGQLAAAAAFVDTLSESGEDTSVSARPNALVLFNPVIDNGPGGYGYDRIGEAYKWFSPLHNIKKPAPPTLILTGKKDKLLPFATAEHYRDAMRKTRSRCDLVLYDDATHGFFNSEQYFLSTMDEVTAFLSSLGYLKK